MNKPRCRSLSDAVTMPAQNSTTNNDKKLADRLTDGDLTAISAQMGYITHAVRRYVAVKKLKLMRKFKTCSVGNMQN